jgi:hypothetical protein
MVAALVLAAVAAVAADVVAGHVGGSGRPLDVRDLTATIGPLGEFGRPTTHVFRQERFYDGYVRERGGAVAAVEFPERMVVLFAVGPRSTTAYRLDVVGAAVKGGRVVVSVRETTPAVGDATPPRLTFPYRAISIPWSSKTVIIDWVGRP